MPAGTLTPPFSAPTAEYLAQQARRDPDWSFTCHVPGHAMPKGSPAAKALKHGPRYIGVIVEREEVNAWVAKVAGIATRDRMRLVAQGDRSFPYEAPVELRALFVFPRPHTQPEGPPIVCQGAYAVGDLDKLVRAIGDALPSGQVSAGPGGRTKVPKAAVIKDDSLITSILTRKAFSDQTRRRQKLEPGVYFKLAAASGNPVDLGYYV